MSLIYLFLGFITAIIGALPLGSTNVAVINTTIKESLKNALKIIYTAAIAEVILVLIAINFNKRIESFIEINIWLQYTIAVILLVVGIILLSGRKEFVKDKNDEYIFAKKPKYKPSKQILGFILGLVNPMVLIYWILVISFLKKKMINVDTTIDYSLIILFLIGVYVGKVIILYYYGKFSHKLKLRIKNTTNKVNPVIGFLLTVVAVFQFVKLYYV